MRENIRYLYKKNQPHTYAYVLRADDFFPISFFPFHFFFGDSLDDQNYRDGGNTRYKTFYKTKCLQLLLRFLKNLEVGSYFQTMTQKNS